MKVFKTLNQINRQPLYSEKLPFILLWSQRAGCTNLTKWFFFQIGLYKKAIEYHSSVHVYKHNIYFRQQGYLHKIRDELTNNKLEIIKLVRDPYKRAVSSFLTFSSYCYSSKPKGSRMYQDWISLNNLFYKSKPYKGMTFKKYLNFLDTVGPSVTNVDGHLAQQYIEGEEHLKMKYIKVEDYFEDIKRLESKYNLKESPYSITSQQKHHHGAKMSLNGDFSNVIITSEMLLSEQLPTYESFYDRENMELCEKIFKKDIERYKYKKITWD